MAKRRPRPAGTSGARPSVFVHEDITMDVDPGCGVLTLSWSRGKGDKVKQGQEIGQLTLSGGAREVVKKITCPRGGTLEELYSQPVEAPATEASVDGGISIKDHQGGGDGAGEADSKPAPLRRLVLGRVSYCPHPCITDGRMCAVCGDVVHPDTVGSITRVFVQGGHHVSVSKTEASSLYKTMSEKLWRARKLNLILDIDLTLLHATIDARAQDIHQEGDKVMSFDVWGPGGMIRHWCCLRPGLSEFLKRAHELYVLTIYTHGRRDYAQQVAKILDPDRSLFKDRIVSRDDCPDLQGQKSLQRLFPGGIEMALIVDDNPHVWQGEQSRHLLPVMPFYFYRDLAEVNRVAGAPAPNQRQFYGDPRQDLQLSHTLRLLEQVHAMYFKDEEEGGAEASPPAPGQAKNVADCLAAIRREVLVGTSLVFSGILPRGVDPRNSDLGHIAQALGAEVTLNVNESTTHVVAENPNTEKVFMARRRPEVHVVKRLWLQLTFLHCERKGEEEFKLPPSAKRASGDGQGQGAADGKRHKVQQEQGNGGEAQPANGQAANGKDAGEVKMAAMEVDRRGEGGKRRGDDDDDDDDEEEEEEEQANGEEEDDEGQGDGEGWDGEEGDGNSRSDAGTQEEEDLMKELEAELMQDL